MHGHPWPITPWDLQQVRLALPKASSYFQFQFHTNLDFVKSPSSGKLGNEHKQSFDFSTMSKQGVCVNSVKIVCWQTDVEEDLIKVQKCHLENNVNNLI